MDDFRSFRGMTDTQASGFARGVTMACDVVVTVAPIFTDLLIVVENKELS